MRAYAYVEAHPMVRARRNERSLFLGQQTQIAEALAVRLGITRDQGNRLTRMALDILGFGEAGHSRNESRSPGPRGKNREATR